MGGLPPPVNPLLIIPHLGLIISNLKLLVYYYILPPPIWTSLYISYLSLDGFFQSLTEIKWVWITILSKDLTLLRFYPGLREIKFTWDKLLLLNPFFILNKVGPNKTTLIV